MEEQVCVEGCGSLERSIEGQEDSGIRIVVV